MRAAVIRQCGGPEVIAIEDVPDPEPGPGEAVVDVLAAVEAAELAPVIDCEMPLGGAREATERLERGEQFGKIVLTMG